LCIQASLQSLHKKNICRIVDYLSSFDSQTINVFHLINNAG